MSEAVLQGKVAIVTGSSRGIGRAIAEQLARLGACVTINHARSAAGAEEARAAVEALGGRALVVQADVSKSADVARLFEETAGHFGGVDILVNNAGCIVKKAIADFTDAEFDRVFDTNFRGAFFGMREAAKRLREGGRIVNIAASFVGAPVPGYGVYAASKMALEDITAVLAKELGGRKITVNAIRPGPTHTELFLHGKTDGVLRFLANQTALGRIGDPIDIARVVGLLVGPDAAWVTGQSFGVNGGYW